MYLYRPMVLLVLHSDQRNDNGSPVSLFKALQRYQISFSTFGIFSQKYMHKIDGLRYTTYTCIRASFGGFLLALRVQGGIKFGQISVGWTSVG